MALGVFCVHLGLGAKNDQDEKTAECILRGHFFRKQIERQSLLLRLKKSDPF